MSFLSECQSIERLTLTLIVELDRYDTLIKKRESEFYIWYDKVYDYQQIYDLLNLKKLAIDVRICECIMENISLQKA